jgi:hypothetical protein
MNARDPLRRPSAHKRLLAESDVDPLAGLANLFDAAMVFAVALLLALVASSGNPNLAKTRQPAADAEQEQAREVPSEESKDMTHYRPSTKTLEGKGRRLGVAYRLESGEVVYVPDSSK